MKDNDPISENEFFPWVERSAPAGKSDRFEQPVLQLPVPQYYDCPALPTNTGVDQDRGIWEIDLTGDRQGGYNV